jgi:hypothetical protein
MEQFVGDLVHEHGERDGWRQVIAKNDSSTEGRAVCGAQFRVRVADRDATVRDERFQPRGIHAGIAADLR